ncbi:MAG TPA: SGNH/GDSL hydrolase family protein [Spongiibacteraceae bacterium]|nr:SGNH/GDSL hydrolase family protein [Spongiibacteraceae bacterium]
MMRAIKYLLFICALILSGCRIDVDKSVLLIGDSLMVNALPEISTQVSLSDDAGVLLMVNAIGGTTFSDAETGSLYWVIRAPKILSAHNVDKVFISLGTNDAWLAKSIDLEVSAGALMDAYNSVQVYWILPYAELKTLLPAGNTYADVVAAIRSAAAIRGNVHLLEFDSYVAVHGYSIDDLLLPNDVHFNASGRKLFAQMICDNIL